MFSEVQSKFTNFTYRPCFMHLIHRIAFLIEILFCIDLLGNCINVRLAYLLDKVSPAFRGIYFASLYVGFLTRNES